MNLYKIISEFNWLMFFLLIPISYTIIQLLRWIIGKIQNGGNVSIVITGIIMPLITLGGLLLLMKPQNILPINIIYAIITGTVIGILIILMVFIITFYFEMK